MIRLHGKQRKGWESVAKLSMGSRWIRNFAGVAQLVEHRICNPKVKGSSPLASSDAQPGPVALTEAQSLTRSRIRLGLKALDKCLSQRQLQRNTRFRVFRGISRLAAK